MAATKKNANTSKTAHVMNLLSKNRDTAPAEAEAAPAEGAPVAGSTPAAPPQTPPVLSSMSSDAEVSAQIKSALEDNLEKEPVAAPEPAADVIEPEEEIIPEPVPEPVPEPAPEPPAAAEPEPVPTPPVEAEPVSVPSEEPEAPAETHTAEPAHTACPEFTCVNVMQVLVEEYAAKYIKMFGVCDCDRCVADIKAIALNNLPPKYVIMDKRDIIPKLTFYEGKYNSDITSQVLQACKTVMNRPHHNR